MTRTKYTEPVRILIVEDSSLTAEQICEAVRRFQPDVNCSIVATEREAVESIADSPPHVVVLDLQLRQGNGFGVLQTIVGSSKRPIVIVMTNYALPQYRDFALLRGADYFLDKAVSIDELPIILRSVLPSQA